ncbi:MAG: hypothetical protein ACRDL5_15185, partial [Solirubrobacteraceae bacterium]
ARPGRWLAVGSLAALIAAVIAAIVLYVGPRTHHGAGPLAQPPPPATPRQVQLCDTCAHAYNPDAVSGPKTQNQQLAAYAIDGNPNTAWVTEQYYDHTLGKPGVGLYVDAKPGAVAGSIRIDTATSGWKATIYATNQAPDPNAFDPGWHAVGSAQDVRSSQTITLATGGVRYRYYLVWITSLGGLEDVSLNEVALYTR